jgi:short-subunit dehydrogenase
MPGSGSVMIITGASSGIGEATARLAALQGYRLVLAARRGDRLEALATSLRAAGGVAIPRITDLSVLEHIERLVQTTLAEFGQIDILFNNAGFGRLNWLEDLDPVQEIEGQLRINLLGAIQTTRAVLPHMLARRKGHIINMASMAGFVGTPTYTIYSAGKFGLRGFNEALRREVGVYGIHVSGIYPSGVATEFSQHVGYQRKTGVTTPKSLRLSAETVARTVLDVARHPRHTVIIPPAMRWVAWVNLLFPGMVDWLVERRFTRPERGL